jgi:hypothetical protein
MHAWSPGSYLPEGTQLAMITSDADQAARARVTRSLAIRLRQWNNCTVSIR